MSQIKSQQAKAELLRELHHSKNMLVLPNIWDPLGASLIEQLGFPAVATASASFAFSNGFDDGEKIPFDHLLRMLKSVVETVSVPVTADVESGYAEDNAHLEENMKKLIATGIAGINFEDSDKKTQKTLPIDIQCEKIRLLRHVASKMDAPVFINARADVYLRGAAELTEEEKLQEAVKRGEAYISAGADGFFPIGLRDKDAIQRLVSVFPHPVNILTLPGVPDLKTLKDLGVARVSMGPGLMGIAVRAMKEAASRFKSLEGLDEITDNPVNISFLRKLALGTEREED